MNAISKEDVIRMARYAGLPNAIAAHPGVKQLIQLAMAAERDACLKAVNEVYGTVAPFSEHAVSLCTAAIRSRGTT